MSEDNRRASSLLRGFYSDELNLTTSQHSPTIQNIDELTSKKSEILQSPEDDFAYSSLLPHTTTPTTDLDSLPLQGHAGNRSHTLFDYASLMNTPNPSSTTLSHPSTTFPPHTPSNPDHNHSYHAEINPLTNQPFISHPPFAPGTKPAALHVDSLYGSLLQAYGDCQTPAPSNTSKSMFASSNTASSTLLPPHHNSNTTDPNSPKLSKASSLNKAELVTSTINRAAHHISSFFCQFVPTLTVDVNDPSEKSAESTHILTPTQTQLQPSTQPPSTPQTTHIPHISQTMQLPHISQTTQIPRIPRHSPSPLQQSRLTNLRLSYGDFAQFSHNHQFRRSGQEIDLHPTDHLNSIDVDPNKSSATSSPTTLRPATPTRSSNSRSSINPIVDQLQHARTHPNHAVLNDDVDDEAGIPAQHIDHSLLSTTQRRQTDNRESKTGQNPNNSTPSSSRLQKPTLIDTPRTPNSRAHPVFSPSHTLGHHPHHHPQPTSEPLSTARSFAKATIATLLECTQYHPVPFAPVVHSTAKELFTSSFFSKNSNISSSTTTSTTTALNPGAWQRNQQLTHPNTTTAVSGASKKSTKSANHASTQRSQLHSFSLPPPSGSTRLDINTSNNKHHNRRNGNDISSDHFDLASIDHSDDSVATNADINASPPSLRKNATSNNAEINLNNAQSINNPTELDSSANKLAPPEEDDMFEPLAKTATVLRALQAIIEQSSAFVEAGLEGRGKGLLGGHSQGIQRSLITTKQATSLLALVLTTTSTTTSLNSQLNTIVATNMKLLLEFLIVTLQQYQQLQQQRLRVLQFLPSTTAAAAAHHSSDTHLSFILNYLLVLSKALYQVNRPLASIFQSIIIVLKLYLLLERSVLRNRAVLMKLQSTQRIINKTNKHRSLQVVLHQLMLNLKSHSPVRILTKYISLSLVLLYGMRWACMHHRYSQYVSEPIREIIITVTNPIFTILALLRCEINSLFRSTPLDVEEIDGVKVRYKQLPAILRWLTKGVKFFAGKHNSCQCCTPIWNPDAPTSTTPVSGGNGVKTRCTSDHSVSRQKSGGNDEHDQDNNVGSSLLLSPIVEGSTDGLSLQDANAWDDNRDHEALSALSPSLLSSQELSTHFPPPLKPTQTDSQTPCATPISTTCLNPTTRNSTTTTPTTAIAPLTPLTLLSTKSLQLLRSTQKPPQHPYANLPTHKFPFLCRSCIYSLISRIRNIIAAVGGLYSLHTLYKYVYPYFKPIIDVLFNGRVIARLAKRCFVAIFAILHFVPPSATTLASPLFTPLTSLLASPIMKPLVSSIRSTTSPYVSPIFTLISSSLPTLPTDPINLTPEQLEYAQIKQDMKQRRAQLKHSKTVFQKTLQNEALRANTVLYGALPMIHANSNNFSHSNSTSSASPITNSIIHNGVGSVLLPSSNNSPSTSAFAPSRSTILSSISSILSSISPIQSPSRSQQNSNSGWECCCGKRMNICMCHRLSPQLARFNSELFSSTTFLHNSAELPMQLHLSNPLFPSQLIPQGQVDSFEQHWASQHMLQAQWPGQQHFTQSFPRSFSSAVVPSLPFRLFASCLGALGSTLRVVVRSMTKIATLFHKNLKLLSYTTIALMLLNRHMSPLILAFTTAPTAPTTIDQTDPTHSKSTCETPSQDLISIQTQFDSQLCYRNKLHQLAATYPHPISTLLSHLRSTTSTTLSTVFTTVLKASQRVYSSTFQCVANAVFGVQTFFLTLFEQLRDLIPLVLTLPHRVLAYILPILVSKLSEFTSERTKAISDSFSTYQHSLHTVLTPQFTRPLYGVVKTHAYKLHLFLRNLPSTILSNLTKSIATASSTINQGISHVTSIPYQYCANSRHISPILTKLTQSPFYTAYFAPISLHLTQIPIAFHQTVLQVTDALAVAFFTDIGDSLNINIIAMLPESTRQNLSPMLLSRLVLLPFELPYQILTDLCLFLSRQASHGYRLSTDVLHQGFREGIKYTSETTHHYVQNLTSSLQFLNTATVSLILNQIEHVLDFHDRIIAVVANQFMECSDTLQRSKVYNALSSKRLEITTLIHQCMVYCTPIDFRSPWGNDEHGLFHTHRNSLKQLELGKSTPPNDPHYDSTRASDQSNSEQPRIKCDGATDVCIVEEPVLERGETLPSFDDISSITSTTAPSLNSVFGNETIQLNNSILDQSLLYKNNTEMWGGEEAIEGGNAEIWGGEADQQIVNVDIFRFSNDTSHSHWACDQVNRDHNSLSNPRNGNVVQTNSHSNLTSRPSNVHNLQDDCSPILHEEDLVQQQRQRDRTPLQITPNMTSQVAVPKITHHLTTPLISLFTPEKKQLSSSSSHCRSSPMLLEPPTPIFPTASYLHRRSLQSSDELAFIQNSPLANQLQLGTPVNHRPSFASANLSNAANFIPSPILQGLQATRTFSPSPSSSFHSTNQSPLYLSHLNSTPSAHLLSTPSTHCDNLLAELKQSFAAHNQHDVTVVDAIGKIIQDIELFESHFVEDDAMSDIFADEGDDDTYLPNRYSFRWNFDTISESKDDPPSSSSRDTMETTHMTPIQSEDAINDADELVEWENKPRTDDQFDQFFDELNTSIQSTSNFLSQLHIHSSSTDNPHFDSTTTTTPTTTTTNNNNNNNETSGNGDTAETQEDEKMDRFVDHFNLPQSVRKSIAQAKDRRRTILPQTISEKLTRSTPIQTSNEPNGLKLLLQANTNASHRKTTATATTPSTPYPQTLTPLKKRSDSNTNSTHSQAINPILPTHSLTPGSHVKLDFKANLATPSKLSR